MSRQRIPRRPVLRPRAGRKLPPELHPDRVGRIAGALPDGLRDPAFPGLLERIDQSPLTEGNRVRIYVRGADAFAAAREAIEGAQREILVESYILKDDATGRAFLEFVGEAAARGVSVKVLADAWGSFATRRGFWREMRQRGVEARLFNPLFPHLFAQPFRDHRKILVADRSIGFTGGMNIGDEYSGAGSNTSWRDTHVRVDGPAVWELTVVFSEAWQRAGGEAIDLPPLSAPAADGAPVLVLDSRPGRGHGETAATLAAIGAAARKRLWITNSYFSPRPRAAVVLGDAVRRGLDVRLLLAGKSDVPIVRHSGHGHYTALLDAGVRIFEYQASILHAKSLVADDFISIVGSSNLDFRSFHFNAECNLVVFGEATAGDLERAFLEDLELSTEITRDRWTRRPLMHRIGDSAAKALGPLL